MTADQSNELKTQPIVNIVGEKVALGPLRRELAPLHLNWINDFEVTRTLGLPQPHTSADVGDAYFQTNKGQAAFTIYERSSTRPIGRTNLDFDYVNRVGDFDLMIGEKDCWNKSYGTETAKLMLDYGFTIVGLHNIMLSAFSFNERALIAYKRAGFKEIGRRRQAHWIGGHAYDIVYMDCLATEFESKVLRQYLPQ